MFAYGCDGGTTGGVCSEAINVSNTSGARLFYPCNISGKVGATTTSSGYLGTYQSVNWLSNRIAGAGFVVLSFTPANQYGLVQQWRAGHKSCIAKLQQLASSHAKLAGKIDTNNLQTCGHSKGGGGSLWAASDLKGTLKTAVGMAPYNGDISGTGVATEGPQGTAIREVTAATFIEAGAADSLATNTMTRSEYRFLGNISKKYVEYQGLGHMAWAAATGNTADRLANDIIAWMKYYMYGDTSQKSTISNQSGVNQYNWVDKGTSGSGGGTTPTGETVSFVTGSNQALDVWEWGTTDGTNIAAYDYWGGDAQKFVLSQVSGGYTLTPVIATGQRVDVSDCSTYAGANIQTWSSYDNNCQKFTLQNTGSGYLIKNVNSGMCLTVSAGNVIQDTCVTSNTNQIFKKITH